MAEGDSQPYSSNSLHSSHKIWNKQMNVCQWQSVLRIRIRDWVPFWPLDPGWEKVSIRIRDEQPGSHFLELRNHFFAFLLRDGDSSDPGWKKVGSGIRDKHPGSATLVNGSFSFDTRCWYRKPAYKLGTYGIYKSQFGFSKSDPPILSMLWIIWIPNGIRPLWHKNLYNFYTFNVYCKV